MKIGHDRIDRIQNRRPVGQHTPGFGGKNLFPPFEILEYPAHAAAAEQAKDHFNAEVGLCTAHAFRTEKTG